MKRIDLKVGFLCNNNCRFCVQGHKKKFGNKEKKELIDAIKRSSKEYHGIVFTGGEPTVRKDIVELVMAAKKSGYTTIQIQTNGRAFAYLSFCRKMIKAGATEFSPALHGHTAALHDHLTNAKGSFVQTVSGIRNLKHLGQHVLTNTVITKSNYRHLPDIAELLILLGVDQIQFAFVHALGSAKDHFDSIVPRKTMVAPYLKKAIDICADAGIPVMTEAVPYCILDGYEEFAAEQLIPETKIYDLDVVIKNFNKTRKNEGKIKSGSCKLCVYFKECEGPWKEYPEKFGWKEFVPVRPVRAGGRQKADGSITPSSVIAVSTADRSRRRSNGVKKNK